MGRMSATSTPESWPTAMPSTGSKARYAWARAPVALRRRHLGFGLRRFGLARNGSHGGCEQRLEFASHKGAESTSKWPAYVHTLRQPRPALAWLEHVIECHSHPR